MLLGRYTLGVSFGRDLKRLRGDRTALDVAARALGDQSSEAQRRDFANHLSRIERDRVPNVGLERLRLIARGLGFRTLTEFFSALEGNPSSLRLPEAQLIAHNPPHPVEPNAEHHDDGRLLPDSIGVAVMFAGVSETLVGIRDAVERLADRIEQVASPRRVTPRRREGGRHRRAKAG